MRLFSRFGVHGDNAALVVGRPDCTLDMERLETRGAFAQTTAGGSTPEFTDPDALIDIVQVHRIPFRILTAENAATTQTNRQANCQHHQQAGVPPAHHEFSERPIAACSTVARPIADCTASSFISA